MIRRNVLFEPKLIEQAVLHHQPLPHHAESSAATPQGNGITLASGMRGVFQQNLPLADIDQDLPCYWRLAIRLVRMHSRGKITYGQRNTYPGVPDRWLSPPTKGERSAASYV